MTDEITLESLLPYRDYMSLAQLERFADYVLRVLPRIPFTTDELKQLGKLRANTTEQRDLQSHNKK
ncbi:MAG TPA: hypothetical protein VHB48_07900 [Chitinophagaceae bacterium]|nr:hypothetical protein [Chitinophagaceae bacterium]